MQPIPPLGAAPSSISRARRDGREVLYLCGNSLGLQPRRAAEDVMAFMNEWQTLGVLGYHDPGADWLNLHERLAPTAAALAGGSTAEVVVMNSLTINLHLLMASFYRPTRERHVILIEQGAFPSDRYAVMSQIAWHGRDPASSCIQVGPRAGEQLLRHEDLVGEIERQGARLALVLLPGVQYLTGQRLDIRELADAAHRVGAVAGFDLAHAIGNLPLALHDWNADFAAWCSYKYLNGGPGATAGAFVHERHFDSAAPRLSGWWGNDLDTRFEMAAEFRPYRGAAGWQVSNHPLLGMVPAAVLVRPIRGRRPAGAARALPVADRLARAAARVPARGSHRDPDASRSRVPGRAAFGQAARGTRQRPRPVRPDARGRTDLRLART